MANTDHSQQIAEMRQKTLSIMAKYPDAASMETPEIKEVFYEATICFAAAALLEVHDNTGISLDDWVGPRELVLTALEICGFNSQKVFKKNQV